MRYIEKQFTVSCRVLASTVGICTCTCNTGSFSALKEPMVFHGVGSWGSSNSLDSCLHALSWGQKHVHSAMHINDAVMVHVW